MMKVSYGSWRHNDCESVGALMFNEEMQSTWMDFESLG